MGHASSIPAGGLRVPSKVRKLGSKLLDQQMWCWGRDIVRPGGNALISYGFVRERPPEGVTASSSYVFHPAPGREFKVWGFGLLYSEASLGDLGGVYLGRRGFSPKMIGGPVRDVWKPRQLPEGRRARTAEEGEMVRHLLRGALFRIAAYERWALEELGLSHREQCVATWHKETVPAEEIPGAWERLARYFDTGEF